jgi:deoxyribose-phosphate aldolase
MTIQNELLRSSIEHTLLRPDLELNEVLSACDFVVENELFGVCVPPYFVKNAAQRLQGVAKTVTVVGFPMGYSNLPSKIEEIKKAVDDKVEELDVVINLAAAKNNDWNYLSNEIESLARACSMWSKKLKLIIEPQLLSQEQLEKICDLVVASDVTFVKTNTGLIGKGVTTEQVELLRQLLPEKIKIKASGGIKSVRQAQSLIKAGASRLGTSQSHLII